MSFLFKVLCIGLGIVAIAGVNLFRYNEPIDTTPLVENRQSAKRSLLSQESEDLDSIAELSELQFVQTFSRPLFSETRKKFVQQVAKKKPVAKKPAQKKPGPAKPPPKLRVLGLSTANGVKKTLVKLATSPNPEWFEEGAKIAGWEVVEINSDSIKIANANREVSVDLFPQKK